MNKIIEEKLKVDSSAISGLSYAPLDESLYVTFVNGSIYNYNDVPENIYLSLKYSKSIGQHFIKYIKDEYNFKKIKSSNKSVQKKKEEKETA